jgi:hypothetical protein
MKSHQPPCLFASILLRRLVDRPTREQCKEGAPVPRAASQRTPASRGHVAPAARAPRAPLGATISGWLRRARRHRSGAAPRRATPLDRSSAGVWREEENTGSPSSARRACPRSAQLCSSLGSARASVKLCSGLSLARLEPRRGSARASAWIGSAGPTPQPAALVSTVSRWHLSRQRRGQGARAFPPGLSAARRLVDRAVV